MPAVRPPPEILALHARLSGWLLDEALPLWWSPGADHAGGGFHDRLDRSGAPIAGPKRARVAARQVFSYFVAGEMGWRGPWRAAMDHGLAFLERAHRRADGLYRAIAYSTDAPADLYDQAFVLLALAAAAQCGDSEAAGKARGLLARLPREAAGGFAGLDGASLEANPNMHLFEAFLAWSEADPAGPWRDLVAGQSRLALTRLIEPETGALSEHFGSGWAAPPSADQMVEPGHLFEWAWLLLRWSLASGETAAFAAGLRLVELAEGCGVDPARQTAVNALNGDLQVADPGTRTWPQTERLRVALLAGILTGGAGFWPMALDAAAGLDRFLAVETSGLWRDSLERDDDWAPASTLYHLVGAIRQLRAVAEGRPV